MRQFFESERYLRLLALNRAGDLVGARQYIERTIAETEGREQAFWILARAGARINLPAPPVEAIMADIRAALSTFPGDTAIEEGALLNLLGLAIRAEQVEDGPRWVRMLRRVLRQTEEPFELWLNLGTFQWRRIRPRAAVRNHTRALTGMYAWPVGRQQAHRVWLYRGHCYRALAATEAGLLELARRDVEAAEDLLQLTPVAEETLLRLAQATLALREGDLGRARRWLQLIHAGQPAANSLRTAHPIRAEVEVVAAQIALAEGNRSAFDHFIARALEIVRQHQLELTARRVRAIEARALAQASVARRF